MLIPEYKRDMNQNYLILPLPPDTDTEAYPIRMLLTHSVPGLLKCTLQTVDESARLYYDITSRCSLEELYESRQLHYEDLQLIFGGFISAVEGLSEYLMNSSTLVLEPAYIYADAGKRSLSFCWRMYLTSFSLCRL